MSVELLEDILGGEQSHTISRDLSEEEIKHIEAMITCEKGGQPAPSGKRWLYEVAVSPKSHVPKNQLPYHCTCRRVPDTLSHANMQVRA